MKQKYILFMLFSLFLTKGNAQTNYTVNAIPFAQYQGSLNSLPTTDDLYSQVISIPFLFDFYGFYYNQFVISTNGYIDFNTNNANQFSNWTINSTIPSATFGLTNSILGCFEDLNNSDGEGTITFGSYGTAPYRKFVVYFNNQSHYGCGAAAKSSFQMVLHETSNIIDVNLIKREPCNTWQAGKGVTGLVNHLGTHAATPPGRNTGNWSALNESWRF